MNDTILALTDQNVCDLLQAIIKLSIKDISEQRTVPGIRSEELEDRSKAQKEAKDFFYWLDKEFVPAIYDELGYQQHSRIRCRITYFPSNSSCSLRYYIS